VGQTLLAVLALALLTFLSFRALSERNETISEHAQALVREEARGLSAGVFERLTALPYQTPVGGRRPARASFGLSGGWPGGTVDELLADIDDLDDLDAVAGVRAEVVLEHPVSGLDNPLVFEAGFTVDYVALSGGDWVVTADTTAHKRVTFRARHLQTDVAVELQRLYSDLDGL